MPRAVRVLLFVALVWCAAATPALAQVDFSGVWAPIMHEDSVERAAGPDIGDFLGLPINDAARQRAEAWDASLLTLPEHQCKPHPSTYGFRGVGNLRIWNDADSDSGQIVTIHTHIQWMEQKREIFMDGRAHPQGDALNPTYLGHSVGKWEGDTLVIDVVGFNEQTWLDYFGHPHTDQLHVVERFSRPNKRTLHYEAVVDDPGAYAKPFTVRWDIPWNATGELTEYICQENNKYMWRLTDDLGQPLFTGKK